MNDEFVFFYGLFSNVMLNQLEIWTDTIYWNSKQKEQI